MPIYHFNVEDGATYPDLTGTELPDLVAARLDAIRRCGDLLRDNSDSFWGGHHWKLIVTDASGLILFTLNFLAVSSPATDHYGEHVIVPTT